MTLRILTPVIISEDDIASTNIALEAVWDTATTYSLGDQVRVDDRLYEVSVETATVEPSDTTTEWFDAGPANRYAAFDLQVGVDQVRVIETKTTNLETITYTITAPSVISGLALMQMSATHIRVVGSVNSVGDVVDIDHILEDYTEYNGSRWRWRYLPQSFTPQFIDLGVDIPQGASIEITITRPGDVAEVGAILMGVVSSFGEVTTGVQRSLSSRSVKRVDGTLTTLLRRTPSAKVQYQIALTDYEASGFWKAVDETDGIAAIFSGSEDHPEHDIYGFISSTQATAESNGFSRASMEVTKL